MSWLYAIGITVGLVIVNDVLLYLLQQMGMPDNVHKILQMLFIAITIFGSAYWVRMDSAKVEINKYEGGMVQGSPDGLAVITILLWPLIFPAYLQKRWMIKNRRLSLKPEFHPNYRKPS